MPRRNLLILLAFILLALVCQQPALKSPYHRVLAGAMSMIESRSLEAVDELELFEGAMEGMLSRFDDNSTYIPPKNLQELREFLDLQFGGVGLQLAIDPQSKQLKVLTPLMGSPACRAGILAGDTILRIGKTNAFGLSLDQAVTLLRGNPGDPITLSILHEGQQKPQDITLVREVIHQDSVLGDVRQPDGSWKFTLEGRPSIGYLRISNFTDDTIAELDRALESLTKQGMRGLILDLRDNPGGYLDSAVEVSKLFIEPGLIVTTRGRGSMIHSAFSAAKPGPYAKLPIAVLVNQYTASAAEIVAACLQDHKRAIVVGQRTYGKGTVQEIINLGYDWGAIKLTTSSYWRPSGKNIQRPAEDASVDDKQEWGVSPNDGYKVELNSDEFARWQLWRAHRDFFAAGKMPAATPSGPKKDTEKPFVDRQLLKAVAYLEKSVKP